jgi:TatD DNase family protein
LSPVLQRSAAAECKTVVCVGTDGVSSREAVALAGRHCVTEGAEVEVYATAGLHPHDAKAGLDELKDFVVETLERGAEKHRLVAIGECGLDYHYDNSPRPLQREVFADQVRVALQTGLALVIHTRDAFDDTLAILRSEGVPARTIFHCFTGGPKEAERCLSTGAFLSFSGIATFKGAEQIREAARLCPLERVLVETDAPFLAPVPHRGKVNEPCYVPFVGELIARERALAVGEVATLTTANAKRAFALVQD